jgi:hypothetical protein
MKKRKTKKYRILTFSLMLMLALTLITGCGSGGEEQEDKKEDTGTVDYKDIGSWQKTKKKAEADKKKHEVDFKITKVIQDQDKIAKELEKYNNSGRGNTIDTAPENDDLEYRIVKYKVKFPKDFPDSDFGLTDVTIGFMVTGLDGKEEIKANEKVYKKLSKTIEIGDLPQGYDFYAGQTYKGKILYMIPKAYKDYLLKGGGFYYKPED